MQRRGPHLLLLLPELCRILWNIMPGPWSAVHGAIRCVASRILFTRARDWMLQRVLQGPNRVGSGLCRRGLGDHCRVDFRNALGSLATMFRACLSMTSTFTDVRVQRVQSKPSGICQNERSNEGTKPKSNKLVSCFAGGAGATQKTSTGMDLSCGSWARRRSRVPRLVLPVVLCFR